MVKKTYIFIISIFLVQCNSNSDTLSYNQAFEKNALENGYILEGTKVFTSEKVLSANIETGLKINRSYPFQKKGLTLKVTRLNYTDLNISYEAQGEKRTFAATMAVDMIHQGYMIHSEPEPLPANVFFIEANNCTLVVLQSRKKEWNTALSDSVLVMSVLEAKECNDTTIHILDGNYYCSELD